VGGLPVTVANPADWAGIKWLAEGAIKLGSGQIITAAMLLGATAFESHIERADFNDAISKFEFDPTNAADVLAARAYVWADHWAPWNYSVPWSGPQHEAVSQSIMALELARPGTLYLASQGDRQSSRYIAAAVADGMQEGLISESRARPANLPATTIATARAAANLKTNDRKRAHHLISANV
jgi:hypothetical protein